MYLFLVAFLFFTIAQGANICDIRDITSTHGVITSPNFPNNYPTSQKCSFSLRVPFGNSIIVSFTAMDLEKEEDEDECYDSVEITDLVNNEKAKYCGKQIPGDFTFKSNHIQITFSSDLSDPTVLPTGFRLTYRTKENIKATSVCPTRQFLATTQGGHLSSPNYPSNYENNLNCKFTLLVPDGKKTHIEFIELKIEYDLTCSKDRLNVSGSVQQRRICGEGQPPTRVLKGNKIYFHFTTNSQTVKNGFLIKYYFSNDESYSSDCVCPRGNAYIHVDLSRRKLIRDTDDIHFEFKTSQATSLILYAMGRHRDFLRVKLVRGQIKFSVDLGTGKGEITVPSPGLNDNKWHKVEVKRNGRRVEVSLDRGRASGIVHTPGIFTKLDLRPPNAIMYVAGSPRGRGPNFIGCLKNFVIDNRRSIADALKGDPAHAMYFASFPRCSG